MSPKVSVIMAVYNAETYLREAVESILNQTFEDFEFLIVQDGSTDRSPEILRSFNDPRIKILDQENRGLTKSLNRMLKEATGEYIARMDADDIALPDRLEKQVAFLDTHPDIALCSAQAKIIDGKNLPLKIRGDEGVINVPLSRAAILRTALFRNPFIHPLVCARKKIFLLAGGYDEQFRYMQDYELWTRIATKYPCANLPDTLLLYRATETGITASKRKTWKYRYWKLKIRVLFIFRLIKNYIF